jgi:hypothetical protein
MTEPPLASFSIPDRFEIDGPVVARHVEERDVPIVAPAFRDPRIGGEIGMPPFDEDELRAALRELLPAMRARGVLVPYVIEDTADGSLLGGITLRHFDPMRGVLVAARSPLASAWSRSQRRCQARSTSSSNPTTSNCWS